MRTNLGVALAVGGGMAVTLGSGNAALAQVGPDGIDWVTVGAVGNQPWQGDGSPGDRAVGRGGVNYEYKIGRFEVTTAQWVEFFNAAFDRPQSDRIPFVSIPSTWGGSSTVPHTPGGRRWQVFPGDEMRAVGNISWRTAAIYTNWLCNGKSLDRSAFMNGAYDVSTFGYRDPFGFSDQLTHNPGATYWIPTWDEWLKASHFDPNKANPDGTRGGWWLYSNGSDTPYTYGPPGVGTANAGPTIRTTIPLGAYANVMSPWGLFDTAGATREWTEEALFTGPNPEFRYVDGSAWGDSGGVSAGTDLIYGGGGDFPSITTFDYGFRIASSVPSPGLSVAGVGVLLLFARRRRRGDVHEDLGGVATSAPDPRPPAFFACKRG